VVPDRRDRSGRAVIGRAASDLAVVTVPLAAGDRFLVAGPRGSGRTSALTLLAAGFSSLPGVEIVGLEGRPGSLSALGDRCICNDHDELEARVAGARGTPVLVVDDADRIEDRTGVLGRLLERPDLLVVVAGRADVLRADYGHWTRGVRRSRAGLLLQPDREVDGELLGAVLPAASWCRWPCRRCVSGPEPGFAGSPERVHGRPRG
jgi:S-DNA-T family DNA segregation ATPase FtsK/SpoIIIE